MWKKRLIALGVLIVVVGVAYFVYQSQVTGKKPFKLGLDLSGGSYLVYKADVTKIPPVDVAGAMDSLRGVIERRINLFGVAEPHVTTEIASLGGEREHRLVVELPGITDTQKAIDMIGQTPLLEFKVEDQNFKPKEIEVNTSDLKNGQLDLSAALSNLNAKYKATKLTGQYLSRATVQFDPTTHAPTIGLRFNTEGAALFEQITGENIGKTVAIYLDGEILSAPVVNQKISGGEAVITGKFTPEEAKLLVSRLNSGALPVPVELISTDVIGPTLGTDAIHAGIMAGVIGLIVIIILLVVWYRVPGIIAVLSLGIYAILMFAIFKIGVSSALLIMFLALIILAIIFTEYLLLGIPLVYLLLMIIPGALEPVALTSAGIAGFIISLGMAVDANILIMERMKEELREGKTISDAIKQGFDRAWNSIRDGNISSIISAIILFWFGTTLIKGFALVFGLGIIISMMTAIAISRIFLHSIAGTGEGRIKRFLFSNGFTK